jgi:hypothetical protein
VAAIDKLVSENSTELVPIKWKFHAGARLGILWGPAVSLLVGWRCNFRNSLEEDSALTTSIWKGRARFPNEFPPVEEPQGLPRDGGGKRARREETSRSSSRSRPSQRDAFGSCSRARRSIALGNPTRRTLYPPSFTFPKGQLPPVKGFWSLTMYDPEHYFSPNAPRRYALGTKNNTLKCRADGGLTIYPGNQSPGQDKETNWLPAPTGNFSIWLCAYWPDQAILDGTWKPPVVEVVK